MSQAGIGGNNSMFIALETTYGDYIDPSGTGVWVPILTEGLRYTEDKYYSPQIRQQTIVSDVKQSYYHAEGQIRMEVDPNYMPYFLYASRHTVTKSGAGPYVYSAVPSKVGSAYPGGTQRGLSITVIRNDVGFGYAGCVVGQWEFTVENGVLIVTMDVLGLGEEEPATITGQTWVDPVLFGADSHAVYVDDSGLTPAFATSDDTYNGFTFRANYNATAQNRIRRDRRASYIAYGETESTYETELDFLDRTEYDNYVAATVRATKFESINPGGAAGTYAAATSAFRITSYRNAYDQYEVTSPGIGDLISANVTARMIGISGGDAFKFECKSAANIS